MEPQYVQCIYYFHPAGLMHELSQDERETSPRFQWLRPSGAVPPEHPSLLDLRRGFLTPSSGLQHWTPEDEASPSRSSPQSHPDSGAADVLPQKGAIGRSVQERLSARLCLMAGPRESRPRRVALIFHALSGTNLLVTCHSPTGSQLKCYDWNRWFWVGSLAPRLPQKGFKVDHRVIFTGCCRLASSCRFYYCAEANLGFRSRRFALITCRVLCYPLRQTVVFRKSLHKCN